MVALLAIGLGIFCFGVPANSYPMLGFRGALYFFKVKDSWRLTNKIFGIFFICGGLAYLLSGNLKLSLTIVVLSICTTDVIAYLLLKRTLKTVK